MAIGKDKACRVIYGKPPLNRPATYHIAGPDGGFLISANTELLLSLNNNGLPGCPIFSLAAWTALRWSKYWTARFVHAFTSLESLSKSIII